jgi:integrase
MNTLITRYINEHSFSWSETTQRSELSRLLAMSSYITKGPDALWKHLEHHKPYTRVTVWTRVSTFYDWLLENGHVKGHNVFKAWRRKNARLFKNAYQKERLDITYEEAKKRIETIPDLAIRKRAFEILYSAQRFSESAQHTGNGSIIGKGGKTRPDFRPELSGPSYDGPYIRFYRALKRVGLKPHMLRKLALTRLVDKGATMFDLMEVAGWSSVQTASSYIQPKNIDRLKKLVHID